MTLLRENFNTWFLLELLRDMTLNCSSAFTVVFAKRHV